MEIRRLKKGEEKEAYKLSDEIFRNPQQKSMGDAFPTIFSPQLIHQSYGGFLDGKLIVLLGLVPSVIRIGNAQLNVYSLGSVCTHPDYRKKGYAAAVLERVLEKLTLTEASLLLISGDRSLYTRAGARLFGETIVYQINGSVTSSTPNKALIREMAVTDIHAMSQLANQREVAFEQTVQELALLINSEAYASCLNRKHKVKVLEESGKVKAFLVAGLPCGSTESNSGIGIEWAGEAHLVAQLVLDMIQSEGLDYFSMPVVWQDKALHEQFKSFNSIKKQNQGTIYLINPSRFTEQVVFYYKNTHKINQMEAYEEKDHITLKIDDQTETLTHDSFISLFFDPNFRGANFSNLTLPFPYTAGLNYV